MTTFTKQHHPEVGDRIGNGSIVLAYTHKGDGGNGFLPHGVAICLLPGNFHPFVVWDLAYSEKGAWWPMTGDYCSTLPTVIEAYRERGGA